MTVLVAGAQGQLGLDLMDSFADDGVVGLSHEDLDIADEAAVVAAIASVRPDVVVNAAAWTDVDGCEGDPQRAHQVNAQGPFWLARECAAIGSVFITVSTDYVYGATVPTDDQGRRRGHTEVDPVGPINVYGRSKAEGERLVRQACDAHHIVRTAWVSGARGRNFVRTMLDHGHDGATMRVVDDQVGSPTFTRDLAAAIREVAGSGRYGTVNRTNEGAASWLELAQEVFRLVGRDVNVVPQSSRDLDRPAARPSWSVLDNSRATAQGLMQMRPWRLALRDLLDELDMIPASEAANDRPSPDTG